jgi:lipopolysaccharide transport system permease protein
MTSEGQPKMLFYMSGLLLWNYFSTNLIKNAETFFINAGLFGKVYFPRLTVPIATTISGLLALFFQFLLLVITYCYFIFRGNHVQIQATLLLFPYLLFLVCMLSMGLGIIVSSLTTKYRDLKHLVNFGMQLAMWVTPVLYPVSQFTDSWLADFIRLNPMSAIIETFRYSIFGTGTMNWMDLAYSSLITFIIMTIGIIIFNKTEKHFIDNI